MAYRIDVLIGLTGKGHNFSHRLEKKVTKEIIRKYHPSESYRNWDISKSGRNETEDDNSVHY